MPNSDVPRWPELSMVMAGMAIVVDNPQWSGSGRIGTFAAPVYPRSESALDLSFLRLDGLCRAQDIDFTQFQREAFPKL